MWEGFTLRGIDITVDAAVIFTIFTFIVGYINYRLKRNEELKKDHLKRNEELKKDRVSAVIEVLLKLDELINQQFSNLEAQSISAVKHTHDEIWKTLRYARLIALAKSDEEVYITVADHTELYRQTMAPNTNEAKQGDPVKSLYVLASLLASLLLYLNTKENVENYILSRFEKTLGQIKDELESI